jgi:hypothetical protein
MKRIRKQLQTNHDLPLDTYLSSRLGGDYEKPSKETPARQYGLDALLTWPGWVRCRAAVEAIMHNAAFEDEPLHDQCLHILRLQTGEPMVLAVALIEVARSTEMAVRVRKHVLPLLGKEALSKAGTILGQIFAGDRPTVADVYRECGVTDYMSYPPADQISNYCRVLLDEPPAWLRASLALEAIALGPKLEELPYTRGKLRRLVFEVGLQTQDLRPAAPFMLENLALAVTEKLGYSHEDEPGRAYAYAFAPEKERHSYYDNPLLFDIAELINQEWDLAQEDQRVAARKVFFEKPSEYAFFLLPRLLDGDETGVGELLARLKKTLDFSRGWIREADRGNPEIDFEVLKRLKALYPEGAVPLVAPLSAPVKTAFFKEVYGMCERGLHEQEGSPAATVRKWVRQDPQAFKETIRVILNKHSSSLRFVVDVVLEPLGDELVPELQDWLLNHQRSYRLDPPHLGDRPDWQKQQEYGHWESAVKTLAEFIVRHDLAAGQYLLNDAPTVPILFDAGYVLHQEDFPEAKTLVSWVIHVDHLNHGRKSYPKSQLVWGDPVRTGQLLHIAATLGRKAAQAAVEACLANLSEENTGQREAFTATCNAHPLLWEAVYWASGAQEESEDGKRKSGGRSSHDLPYLTDEIQDRATSLLATHRKELPSGVGKHLVSLFRQIALASDAGDPALVQQFLNPEELRTLLIRKGPFYRAKADDTTVYLPASGFWKEFFTEPADRERLAKWLLSNAYRTSNGKLLDWIEAFGFETDERFWRVLDDMVDGWGDDAKRAIGLLRKVRGIPETSLSVA